MTHAQPNKKNHPKHDQSYRQLFSHAHMVEELLRGFVDEDWVDRLDYTTLEPAKGSYVSDDLKGRCDDAVWRIKLKQDDQWLYLYLLLEFQRRNDPWMALRIMVYVGLLYQDLIKTGVVGRKKGQLRKLPAVLPMVIYNGKTRWTAAVDVHDLIEPVPEPLSRYVPTQTYWLLDEGRTGEEALPPTENTFAEVVRLENSPDPAAMQEVIARLTRRLASPEHNSLRIALTTWIKKVLLKKKLLNDDTLEINDLDEVTTMLEERMEQWSQKLRQEGKIEGRIEGKIEGKIEGEAAVLERLLFKRFGPLTKATEQKLKTATLTQLEIWTDRILDATRIEDVFSIH
jgi:predicted transposase/invertase (TIGR01784 family)